MSTGSASKLKRHDEAARPKMVVTDGLANLIEAIKYTIASRAYELYEARGREDGRDLEDWFRAEAELVRPVPIKITEAEDQLTLRAQVPGFSAEEVTVGIEPRRIIIWGKKERPGVKETQRTIQDQFLRVQDLPGEVDPTKAMATLQGGVLDVTLSKVNKR